jgi:hypothetical protein
MQLANALCRYWEMAEKVNAGAAGKKPLAQAFG